MEEVPEKKTEMEPETTIYDEDRNTPLHSAAAHGKLEDVTKCLEKYKKVDMENFLGWTPLMMATRNGHLEIVKLLIDSRANATKSNHFGCSVFMAACANGNLDIIEYLLQHLLNGGVSRQMIESTLAPISIAILFGHDHIMQVLIAKGFNVNAEAAFTAITPLMYAAAMKNTSSFNILISHGANLFAKNINKQTAQDIMETPTGKKANKSNLHLQIGPQVSQDQQQPQPYLHVPSPVAFLSPTGMIPSYPLRSSNTCTPFMVSPGVSPIGPYMFFPPNFNPYQFVTPINGYCYPISNVIEQPTEQFVHHSPSVVSNVTYAILPYQ